jgi:hypothetical protein
MNQHNWARSIGQYYRCHAAMQQARDTAASVRTHDDQVNASLSSIRQNALPRLPNIDNRGGSDFMQCQIVNNALQPPCRMIDKMCLFVHVKVHRRDIVSHANFELNIRNDAKKHQFSIKSLCKLRSNRKRVMGDLRSVKR